MRVLIAPDSYAGTLSAAQAAEAIAVGWRRRAPDDELDLCPMSDGGPGFLDVLHAALGGRLQTLTVPGPLGEPAPAAVLLARPAGTDAEVAYVESAQACGLHLVPADRRDPGAATTAGLAGLLRAARELSDRIVVGLGGAATNDAGAALLHALADRPGPAPGGGALAGTTAEDLDWLPGLASGWAGADITVASDVDSPLLGPSGASRVFAEQKGATPRGAAALDAALTDFARAAVTALGLPQRVAVEPGAGAAGGLGFGLFLLGARRRSGAELVAEAVGLGDRLARCDLAVTGEGTLDWQSLRGKVVTGVAQVALPTGVPVIALPGQLLVGRRELVSIGVQSAYPVARSAAEVPAALADPAGTLAARAERVARTWSR